MIDWFRSWSKEIIVAVIISTVIEMLLPNISSKKYIKIISGIFIVYTIISPVIGQFVEKDLFDFTKYENAIEASSKSAYSNNGNLLNPDSYIKNVYVKSLEDDVYKRLETNGYIAGNVRVKIYDDDSYKIEKVDITINEKKAYNNKNVRSIVDNIKDITIKINNNSNEKNSVINNNDKDYIKKLIKENYDIDVNCIQIT